MLSTPLEGTPSAAPPQALLPSDRPPDLTSKPSLANTGTAHIAAATDMITYASAGSGVVTRDIEIADSPATATEKETVQAQEPPVQIKPTAQFSYASAVRGWKSNISFSDQASQWTPVGENDLIPGSRNGEPALNISATFKERICAPWHRTIVVRLLGTTIGFNTLCSRLRGLWRPTDAMEIMDLDQDCFLVKLSNEQDYFRALTDGPWTIFDHYLAVQQWSPNFKVSDPLPRKMIVWVQFPALKIHFYHKEIRTSLGNLLGRTIRLDFHTLNLQRAKFARIVVEVDLSKPLVPRIWLDDAWQKVEYENLPDVCFECGKIGHSSLLCPKLRLQSPPPILAITGGEVPANEAEQGEEESTPGFGLWMLVSRKSRRNSRDPSQKGKLDSSSKNANGIMPAKQGKQEVSQKEGGRTAPISPQTPQIHLNGHPTMRGKAEQERNTQEKKKGKEPASTAVRVGGKGLLGPIPETVPFFGNGQKPKDDHAQASTSSKSPLKSTTYPKPKDQTTPLPKMSPPVGDSATGIAKSKSTPPAVQTDL
ncbi:unnamed protein product [Linum tenue]|uniref:CCHC-type domain-containing protein n=1 Tax=Linum tenue TaxID=586396 RepID=A0AAV0JNK7_9ROSI|nr:unnamed protein product [Linum tenue]